MLEILIGSLNSLHPEKICNNLILHLKLHAIGVLLAKSLSLPCCHESHACTLSIDGPLNCDGRIIRTSVLLLINV